MPMEQGACRTPIFLLTGFLGSGKTTVLNALLKAPEYANTAVIVNEFGEIGLDHFLMERSQDNVVLLEAGCLCCTISDSLHETLADLNARRVRGDIPAFTRVVIETTGLADPAPILNTLLGNRLVTDHYRLEAAVVTVDAQHVMDELKANQEVAKQIAVADRLLLTKTDLAPAGSDLIGQLKKINALAPIIISTSGSAALKAFEPLERHRLAFEAAAPAQDKHEAADHGHHHDHHHHGHDDHGGNDGQAENNVNRHDAHIRAHCLLIEDPASWAGLAAWWRLVSESFGNRLLRCKGVLRIAETGEILFIQGVQRVFHRPERLADWPDADHRSRLVCITRDVNEAEVLETLDVLQIPAGTDPQTALIELKSRRTRQ
jgi:G3E family GTPase